MLMRTATSCSSKLAHNPSSFSFFFFLFGIVIAVAIQNAFCLEIHQNDIFFIFKN
jgi:hypothetical protein